MFFGVVALALVGIASMVAYDRINGGDGDRPERLDPQESASAWLGLLLAGDVDGFIQLEGGTHVKSVALAKTVEALEGCSIEGATYRTTALPNFRDWPTTGLQVTFAAPCGGTAEGPLTHCWFPFFEIFDGASYIEPEVACQ